MKVEDFIIGQLIHINNTNLLGVIVGLHMDSEDPVEVKVIGYDDGKEIVLQGLN